MGKGGPETIDGSRGIATTLDVLYAEFAKQKSQKPDASKVADLLRQDVRKIAKKLGEEAVETAVAAVAGSRAEVIAESSDLLFRLLVLWAKVGVEPAKVMADLAARHGPKIQEPTKG
jgi:phosphoribosyl-ATP pyrophosphohydrolase